MPVWLSALWVCQSIIRRGAPRDGCQLSKNQACSPIERRLACSEFAALHCACRPHSPNRDTFVTGMPVPNRPTTGQKATITRGLNLQAATKKDVELLGKQIHSIEKQIAKVQNTQTKILRALKSAAKRRRSK
jgi:hypothetical protein